MRTPSVKALSNVFDNAKEAKRVLQMARFELLETDAGQKYHDRCYNSPNTESIRQHVLNALDDGLYGVEAIEIGSEWADYLNTGESYAPTLIYWRNRYRVQSVGDFIEVLERQGFHID